MADEESVASFRMRLLGATVSTFAIIVGLVPLKLWCRVRAGGWANLGWDDVFSVIGLVLASAFNLVCLIGMWPALGVHIAELESDQIVHFLKTVFVAQLLYTLSISFTKFSILAFYWRLFSVTARLPLLIMSFIVFGWMISICCALIFTCTPVQASWDLTILDKSCHSTKAVYTGGSLPNAITDIVLIIMPLPYVWRLQAPIPQRLLLASLFMLGIFIAIVSVVRLIIFLHIPFDQADDVTFHFREIIVWSSVEVNVGLACACLPSLKPALSLLGLSRIFSFVDSRNLYGGSSGPGNKFQSDSGPSGGTDDRSRKPRKKGATGGLFSTIGVTRLDDESEEGFQLTDTKVHGATIAEVQHGNRGTSQDTTDHASQDSRIANGGISVQKDWSVKMERSAI